MIVIMTLQCLILHAFIHTHRHHDYHDDFDDLYDDGLLLLPIMLMLMMMMTIIIMTLHCCIMHVFIHTHRHHECGHFIYDDGLKIIWWWNFVDDDDVNYMRFFRLLFTSMMSGTWKSGCPTIYVYDHHWLHDTPISSKDGLPTFSNTMRMTSRVTE